MTVQQTALSCMACKHKWTGETLNNVAISVWTAQIRSIRCPNCGAKWKRIAFDLSSEEEL